MSCSRPADQEERVRYNYAIYSREAALPCLTCPHERCIHLSTPEHCERFMAGLRAATNPAYCKCGRKKASGI